MGNINLEKVGLESKFLMFGNGIEPPFSLTLFTKYLVSNNRPSRKLYSSTINEFYTDVSIERFRPFQVIFKQGSENLTFQISSVSNFMFMLLFLKY